MLVKLLFLMLFSICLCYDAEDSERNFKVIDSITDEPRCLEEGGRCVIAEDCPSGYLSPTLGLCSTQNFKGVECCYSASIKETRCRQRGGSCRPPSFKCPKRYRIDIANDCEVDETCCILV